MMALLNDRDTEMAAGSAWTTQAADDNKAGLLGSLFGDALPSNAPTDAQSASTGADQASSFDLAGLPLDGLASGLDSVDSLARLAPLNLLGEDTTSPLTLTGPGAELQPVLNVPNTAVLDVHSELEVLSHDTGLSDAIHGLTTLGETVGLGRIGAPVAAGADGQTNLLTDVLNAPGQILDGNIGGVIDHVGSDLSDVVNAAANLKDALVFGNDPTNPIGDLVANVGGDLQNIPLLTANGGNNANDGGLLGGTVGSLNPTSSGHLINLDVGPQTSDGQQVDLLSAPEPGPNNALEVHAVDTTPGTPQLVDLGLLTGQGVLNIPGLNGSGSDSLVGNLLHSASANTTSTPVAAAAGDTMGHEMIGAPLLGDHGILDHHGGHLL